MVNNLEFVHSRNLGMFPEIFVLIVGGGGRVGIFNIFINVFVMSIIIYFIMLQNKILFMFIPFLAPQ